MLQPHFEEVWKFQGWNLAYNVSAEWDGVVDRYHWVKEGGKFMIKGTNRNQKLPELYHDTGRILGSKIGRADEKKFFRKFFLDDPIIEGGGPDPEINPEAKDNYLVAKVWFQQANKVEAIPGINARRLARVLFRSYPARSQMDYAQARQDEGLFDEVTREAWEVAYEDVTKGWGAERFAIGGSGWIVMEATDEVLMEMVKEKGNQFTLEQKKRGVKRRQDMSNYRYWRMHCLVEKKPEMIETHRNLYQGKRAFIDRGDVEQAEKMLIKGLTSMELIMAEYSELELEDDIREECLKSIVLWQAALKARGEEVPDVFPLKYLWDSHPEEAARQTELFRATF
ncbi:MAG: hypothetical protein JKY95_06625 [Planctomycetaceae bacterium]|nr:hypothetical protein [Planctomycetaceae bacterium]